MPRRVQSVRESLASSTSCIGTPNSPRKPDAGHESKNDPKAANYQLDIRLQKGLLCQVHFLDGTSQAFCIGKNSKGQSLLDLVYRHLDLVEKDYFGLQFCEPGIESASPSFCESSRWLNALKVVKKQVKDASQPVNFYFRVKFYVDDPSKLKEEYTRYQFFLQICSDIKQAKLVVPPTTACLLASYAVQAEFGDYTIEEHGTNHRYLSGSEWVLEHGEDAERKIMELHKLHKGQSPADAEYNFLDHAKRLEMYGVDLHKAKDSANKDLFIGVSSKGVLVFHNGIRVNTFCWSKIVKISFKQTLFMIQLHREAPEDYDTLLCFNLVTYRSCKNLWRSCVEYHAFFRLETAMPPSRTLKFSFGLGLGSKFRYSGRSQHQTVMDTQSQARIQPFFRFASGRHGRKTVTGIEGRAHGSVRFPSASPLLSRAATLGLTNGQNGSNGKSFNGHRSHDSYRVQSKVIQEPRIAWAESSRSDDSDGGFLTRPAIAVGAPILAESPGAFSPAVPLHTLAYADDYSEKDTASVVASVDTRTQVADDTASYGVLCIRMQADANGRFGFNIRGGIDEGGAVIVSRVASNTAADMCYPRLNEGDQLLSVNGRPLDGLTHDEVVALIRESAQPMDGSLQRRHLELTVKHNEYEGEEVEESPFVFVLDTPTSSSEPSDAPLSLAQSMTVLDEGLRTGWIMAQFELLHRKNPGWAMGEAKRVDNVKKNRYNDISPYDSTRVLLRSCPSGDYINANYVYMGVPSVDVTNKYIATQGPLPNTVGDFWLLVWQGQCPLIVMLTALQERGRNKCHCYWPELHQTLDLDPYGLQVTCTHYVEKGTHCIREFTLTDHETGEERSVIHFQYLPWPDHGVPEAASVPDFLKLIVDLRTLRSDLCGPDEHVLVHCSAGIGRTGVLILLDTAMAFIEANQPVMPLDIVKTMRDQRPMMIQTAVQFKFACECIQRIFREGVVRAPLELAG